MCREERTRATMAPSQRCRGRADGRHGTPAPRACPHVPCLYSRAAAPETEAPGRRAERWRDVTNHPAHHHRLHRPAVRTTDHRDTLVKKSRAVIDVCLIAANGALVFPLPQHGGATLFRLTKIVQGEKNTKQKTQSLLYSRAEAYLRRSQSSARREEYKTKDAVFMLPRHKPSENSHNRRLIRGNLSGDRHNQSGDPKNLSGDFHNQSSDSKNQSSDFP